MDAILVTGGTGTIGRHVVRGLRAAKRDVRVLARDPRRAPEGIPFFAADLRTGDGLDAALAGVGTVVHLAGAAKGDDAGTRHLVEAARRQGRPIHVVYLSVVGAERVAVRNGVDRAMFGYFAMKRACEEIVAMSGLPWTTLRAAQVHDSLLRVVQAMARFPVVPVPAGTRFQAVDTEEVADRVVALALGAPSGLVADLAGPHAIPMEELVRGYLAASGRRARPFLRLRMPGAAARSIREGANLPLGPGGGKRTWEEFLAARDLSAAAASS